MITNALKVVVFVIMCMALLVACADKGYINVPVANTNLEKVHSSAVACSDPAKFQRLSLRKVAIDRVAVNGKTTVTLSTDSLKNLQYNLRTIDEAVGAREAYSLYLRDCLLEIAEQSVTVDTSP